MFAWKAVRVLIPIDFKNVQRDPMLRWFVFIPLFMIGAMRFLIPWLMDVVLKEFGFDLHPYGMLIMSLITLATPMMIGIIIGFLLLDQRDDRTLTALQVTPLSLNGYLLYRVLMPMLLAIPMTALVVATSGWATLDPLDILLVSVACAPMAPMYALFYALVAENKVQGFAVSKGSGVIMLPVMVAYFIPSNWQYLLGIAPPYWAIKVFWILQSGESGAWLALLLALVYPGVLTLYLLRLYVRKMHRE